MLTNGKIPRVIITRPEKQAVFWAEKLRSLNIDTLLIPLMEIKSFDEGDVENELRVRRIKNCVLDLDHYQKIIFVSQNAVEYGMEWIETYWPQLPVGIDFFAVGETTANLLRDYGIAVQNLAGTTQGEMNSESLLSASALQDVEGDKILIIRGVGGRGYLADELGKRGAQVQYCEVYQRQLPDDAKQKLLSWLQQNKTTQDLLVFHSGETLNNFQQLLVDIEPEIAMDLQSLRNNLSILIPGIRLQQEALAAGFTQTAVAMNATDEAMTVAVNNYFWSN